MLKPHTLLIFIALLLINSSFAQDDSFVEADAHEHGAALMTLVVENDTLTLDFISPAINIVGFEYAPKTDEEKAVVSQALLDLGNVEQLISFSNGASCSMVSSNIATELSEDDGHSDEHHDEHGKEHGEEEHHDEDGEEHHEGEEEHHEGEEEHHEGEEEHHDEDGEEHHEGEEEHHDEHGHDEEESVHSEFHASYTFTCNNVNRLEEIDLKGLFEQYPNVLDLDLQYVTEDTQGAAELNASQSVLKF